LVSVQKQLGCFLLLFGVISPKKCELVFERGIDLAKVAKWITVDAILGKRKRAGAGICS
jgi:hypothetical protein